MEKLWSDCSKEEHKDARILEKRKRKLEKYISLGYLTKQGEEYFKKDLLKDVNRIEKRYRDV